MAWMSPLTTNLLDDIDADVPDQRVHAVADLCQRWASIEE